MTGYDFDDELALPTPTPAERRRIMRELSADTRRRPILVVACKARDLTDTLSESILADIHAKLEELIQSSQRCPYVLTPEGIEAADRYDRETLELIK